MPRCCGGDVAPHAVSAPTTTHASPSSRSRLVAIVEWALPIATLSLIPKCPGCVAGYVLLLTGMGISFTAASTLRWSIIGLSIAALVYLLFRVARRTFARFALPA